MLKQGFRFDTDRPVRKGRHGRVVPKETAVELKQAIYANDKVGRTDPLGATSGTYCLED
jgi:hypothetical protein